MNHYFENNTDLKSNEKTITFTYKDKTFTFISDHGVFSKDAIDYGSRVLLEKVVIEDDTKTILDVGCGYGPIGISIAKTNENVIVDMIDVNQRAIELTKRNKELNDIVHGDVLESDGYTKIIKKYDMIITNPPIRAGKDVVHRILSQAKEHLNKDGSLWVVIQKKQGAPSAKEKMISVFGDCEIIGKDKGYYILKSINK